MVRTTIGVECASCGLTSGTVEASGDIRCGGCGRYAERSKDFCARHNVNIRNLPPGYSYCPKCRLERDRAQREQERMARRSDPNMHPTVDAPANAIDHSAGYEDFI